MAAMAPSIVVPRRPWPSSAPSTNSSQSDPAGPSNQQPPEFPPANPAERARRVARWHTHIATFAKRLASFVNTADPRSSAFVSIVTTLQGQLQKAEDTWERIRRYLDM
eukprot:Rmarinus@m.26889